MSWGDTYLRLALSLLLRCAHVCVATVVGHFCMPAIVTGF